MSFEDKEELKDYAKCANKIYLSLLERYGDEEIEQLNEIRKCIFSLNLIFIKNCIHTEFHDLSIIQLVEFLKKNLSDNKIFKGVKNED